MHIYHKSKEKCFELFRKSSKLLIDLISSRMYSRKQKGETIQRLSILDKKKKIKRQQKHPAWMNIPVLLFHNFMKNCESQAYGFPINSHIFSRPDLHKGNQSSLFGKFPFSELLSKEIKNAPSAWLSYKSTRDFLRRREKCGEARAKGECFPHFSRVLKNSRVLI